MTSTGTPAPATAPAGAASAPHARALEILSAHGDHSSGFLTMNRGMEYFTASGCEGLVAYRRVGRRDLFQLCGPFAAPADRGRVLGEFLDWAEAQGRRVCAIQLRPCDLDLYAEHGFTLNQVGCSYSIDLEEFSLSGTRFMKVRNKISRARRLGVTVDEVPDGGDPQDLAALDAEWLRDKGRHASELAFLVGERGGAGAPLRRILKASLDGRPVAYVTYSPVMGTEAPGWLYDLTRRGKAAPPGTIELLFATGIERLREEGQRWLHLGLTPFVGIEDRHRVPAAESRAIRTFLDQFGRRGSFLYSAETQEAFKLKWAPSVIEPEYLAFRGGPSLGGVFALMRVTRVIPV